MTARLNEICAIAVMAKAPRAGHVKTRLCPPLTPDEARLLGAAFLRDTTENIARAAESASIHGYVAFAPAGSETLFDGALADGTRLLLADGAIDPPDGVKGLGLSLLHALRGLQALGYGAVCLLNADGPTLPTGRLIEAARVLLGARDTLPQPLPRWDGGSERASPSHLGRGPGEGLAVLGPAEDGGYYLLGLRGDADPAALLRGIDWSTDRVAEQTRERADEAGIEMRELAPWYDVDDAAALTRLLAELRAGAATMQDDDDRHRRPFAARATAAAIAGMDFSSRL